MKNSTGEPRRVAIVGAVSGAIFRILNLFLVAHFQQGSAGTAAAFALSNHPDKFKVTIFDKQSVLGGMATAIP